MNDLISLGVGEHCIKETIIISFIYSPMAIDSPDVGPFASRDGNTNLPNPIDYCRHF